MKLRIAYLDGQRGLAILLVVFFHAYARWPTLVPYHDNYSHVLIFEYGWLGVELFFLISGFVILMTLEKCGSIKEFLYRRWLRLFPAMLICTVVIFITAHYFSERPAGIPTWESVLPGLTFIEPAWWIQSIGYPFNSLEGAFWSLYVEFKFYVFAAIVYYWRGRTTLVTLLVLVFLIAVVANFSEIYFGIKVLTWPNSVIRQLSFQYFGWFASGAAFYLYKQTKLNSWFGIALAAAIASSITVSGLVWQGTLAAIFISFIFIASIVSIKVQNVLSNQLFQFFGAISYPLYLFHENMMISMILKLGKILVRFPQALLPLPVIAFLSVIAFLISRYVEPSFKSNLIAFFKQNAWVSTRGTS